MPLGAFKLNSLAKYSAPSAPAVYTGREPKPMVAQGNAQISTAQSKFGSSSALFDGTGDYIEVANKFNWHGSSTGTIECWIRWTDTTPFASGLISQVIQGANTGWQLLRVQTKLYWYESPTSTILSTSTVSDNTWYHVAIVKESSTTVKMYLDGVLQATDSSASGYTDATTNLWIGRGMGVSSGLWDATRYDHNGHIDEIRISSTARYTAAFTPPSAAFINDENTVLLIHADGTNTSTNFIDDAKSRTTGTITVGGNAKQVVAQSKFGNSSAAFDGAGDYVQIVPPTSASQLAIGSGNFTIEFWVRFTANTATGIIVDTRGSSNNSSGWCLYVNSGTLRWYQGNSDRITSSSLATATWYHVAISRSGNDHKMFINGTQAGSTYTSANTYVIGTTANGIWFGESQPFPNQSNSFSGHLDEIRISNTARYTANFTASTTPFVDDINTMLLLHCNGTDASTIFVDDAVQPQTATGPFTSDPTTAYLIKFDGTNGSTTVTDSSSNAKAFTRITGSLTTSFKKFGTAGWNTLSPTGYFTYAETAFGTKDFTYELWAYQTSRGQTVTIFGTYIGCYVDINGFPGYFSGGLRTGNVLLPLNTWTHIAYVRYQGVITLYVGGVEAGRWSNTTNFATATVGIGANADGSYGFNTGYFDEIRVSNVARYLGPFTPN